MALDEEQFHFFMASFVAVEGNFFKFFHLLTNSNSHCWSIFGVISFPEWISETNVLSSTFLLKVNLIIGFGPD